MSFTARAASAVAPMRLFAAGRMRFTSELGAAGSAAVASSALNGFHGSLSFARNTSLGSRKPASKSSLTSLSGIVPRLQSPRAISSLRSSMKHLSVLPAADHIFRDRLIEHLIFHDGLLRHGLA